MQMANIAIPSTIVNELTLFSGEEVDYRTPAKEYLDKVPRHFVNLMADDPELGGVDALPIDIATTRIGLTGIGEVSLQQVLKRNLTGFLRVAPHWAAHRPPMFYVAILDQVLRANPGEQCSIVVFGGVEGNFVSDYANYVRPDVPTNVTVVNNVDELEELFNIEGEKVFCAAYDLVIAFGPMSQRDVYWLLMNFSCLCKDYGLMVLPYSTKHGAYEPCLDNFRAIKSSDFEVVHSTRDGMYKMHTRGNGLTIVRKKSVSSRVLPALSPSSSRRLPWKTDVSRIAMSKPHSWSHKGPVWMNPEICEKGKIRNIDNCMSGSSPGIYYIDIKEASLLYPHGIVFDDEGVIKELSTRLHRSETILKSSGIFKRDSENLIVADTTDHCPIVHNSIIVPDSPTLYMNYWHWTHEYIPRLVLALECQDHKEKPIIVVPPIFGFHHETYSMLAQDAKRLVYLDSPGLRIKNSKLVSFGVFEKTMWEDAFARGISMLQSESDVSAGAAGKRIFISRNLARARKIINEEEVFAILQRKGFERIFAETLSFREQIELFSAASHVVGIEGAGFANIMFCPSEARIFAIHTINGVDDHLPHLSTAMSRKLDYVVFGALAKASDWMVPAPSVVVDIDRFEVAINEWVK